MPTENDESTVKSGIFTTEFWTTLAAVAANLLTVFVVLGKISPEDAKTLGSALGVIFTSLPVLLANVLVVWNYVAGRTAVKQTASRAAVRKMKLRLAAARLPRQVVNGEKS